MNITEFKVSSCSNISKIEGKEFNDGKNLEKLIISNTTLKYIAGNSFDQLVNVIYFDLSSNKIENLDEHIFSKMKKLAYLFLSDNKLHNVPYLENLTTLSYLKLDNNQISAASIQKLNYLKTFMVDSRNNTDTNENDLLSKICSDYNVCLPKWLSNQIYIYILVGIIIYLIAAFIVIMI